MIGCCVDSLAAPQLLSRGRETLFYGCLPCRLPSCGANLTPADQYRANKLTGREQHARPACRRERVARAFLLACLGGLLLVAASSAAHGRDARTPGRIVYWSESPRPSIWSVRP